MLKLYNCVEKELDRYRKECNFTELEKECFDLRAKDKSITAISLEMKISASSVSRLIKSINTIEWQIVFVSPTSPHLYRSDGSLTCGVTDFSDCNVYLADNLHGDFLRKVLCHELCHCFCFSYDITIPIEQEEFLADWISQYGEGLIYLLDDLIQIIMYQVA